MGEITLHQLAELISLSLTLPTLVLAAVVVYIWGPSVYIRPKSDSEWFILGVVAGFIGSFLDNLYWSVPWTSSFLGLEYTSTLMMSGVYFNIFFRQGLGIFAGYCHLKAANSRDAGRMSSLNSILAYANLAGVAYSIVIVILYLRG
jgi:hypothetical protein